MKQSEIVRVLEAEAQQIAAAAADLEVQAFRVTVLVLRDYVEAGNYPLVSQGRIFLANLLDSESLTEAQRREALRWRYQAARDRALRDRGQLPWLQDTARMLRETGYAAHEVVSLLQAGPPDLAVLDAKENRQSLDVRGLWRCTRATWSMAPEASAPGREVAFLVVDRRHQTTPLGILQFRNVVPEIRSRDFWLGVAVGDPGSSDAQGYLSFLGTDATADRRLTSTRDVLQALLLNVNTDGIPFPLEDQAIPTLGDLAARHRQLFDETRRSGHQALENEHLRIVKRAQTAQDLLRGIRAIGLLLGSTGRRTHEPTLRDLDAGLTKLWHYHMGFVALEMSVCGAAPPFGPLRVGKLMAALAGASEILEAWGSDRPLGHIAQEVYRPTVRSAVPNLGPLVVFTSGLYPGHSAQYSRVRVGERPWRKIGSTTGFGSSHISIETAEAMRRLNRLADGYVHITRAFGEGSGARFRSVGRALSYLGLPDLRRHQTQRPLYALSLVDNPRQALLGWEPPVRTAVPPAQEVAKQWWERWVAPRATELAAQARRASDLEAALLKIVARHTGP
jgi:hypothetical protein